MSRDHRAGRHPHILQNRAAAGRGALTETVPVVDDGQARIVTLNEGDKGLILLVDARYRHDMRKQSTGAVELFAVQHRVLALKANARLKGSGVFAFRLRERIAKAITRQRLAEVMALLLFGAGLQQDIEHTQMVLRDLPKGRVGGRDEFDHFRDGDVGHPGTAVGFWHGDGPQPAGREFIQFSDRQTAFAITQRSFFGKAAGQCSGDVDGFGVRGDDVRYGRCGGWSCDWIAHGLAPDRWRQVEGIQHAWP
ncbi:acyl-homoserine lactone acylase subunit beta [Pseudomonas syringae pv. spinaceae]|uniref:Acyl-homoserine lactone acylase subunit beta n=1 Tax=Pseudomonas syringae pv. spinaceae TaxID=264459 RepID=A0A0Q0AXI5_PSESX|nr:acyl-homoserine lactone acylase subunit beta [Pseudomonas syringae pv. spinaceae]